MQINKISFTNKTFYWTGLNSHGSKITGEINAKNIQLARFNLIKQGIAITEIHKKSHFIFNKYHKKITALDISIFFRQFATLIAAGVPIIQSCEILLQSQNNLALRAIIAVIKTDLETGKNLALGLRKFPLYFDDFTCHLIHIGEQTGTFVAILKRIAFHKEKMLSFKNKIKQALFYPAIISIVAIIVCLIMLTMIVPRFAELFENTQQSLPAFTLSIIYLSQFIRNYGWVLLFPICSIIALRFYFINFPQYKYALDSLKIPILHTFFQKIIITNFVRSLATSLSAGAPITDILKIIAKTSRNNTYTQALRGLQIEISNGQQLHKAMQKNILFPNLLIQMVKIGEESGMLEHMLEKIADLYEADIDYSANNLSHLLEPLIMVILGVLIGGLVIAMYLPIFKLGNVL